MSQPITRNLRRLSGVGLLMAAAVSVSACYGTTTTTTTYTRAAYAPPQLYGYSVTYVQAPPQVAYYPRTYYRGGYAYLVEGRWYYQSRGRWVVFRDEPNELQRYRVYDSDRLEAPQRYRPGSEYGTPRPPAQKPRYYQQPSRVREPSRPVPAPAPPPQQQRYYR